VLFEAVPLAAARQGAVQNNMADSMTMIQTAADVNRGKANEDTESVAPMISFNTVLLNGSTLEDVHKKLHQSASLFNDEVLEHVPEDQSHAHQAANKEFGTLPCKFIQLVMSGSQGKSFQIDKNAISSPWWNTTSGTCSAGHVPNLQQQRMMAPNGLDQILMLHPPIDPLGDAAKELTFLLRRVRDECDGQSIVSGGTAYKFKVSFWSPIDSEMLEYAKWIRLAPFIFGVAIFGMCVAVGYTFSSVGLGFKMLLTVVLPLVAEFGIAVGTFQHGWLEILGYAQSGGLCWTTVFIAMGFPMALALDYDIFLFARVYERRFEGYDNISAVKMAMTETTGVITVAGTMMCISFFAMSRSEAPVFKQMGFLWFISVLIDTFVIRFFLAPSVLCLSEKLTFWPGKVPKAVKSWDGYDIASLEK
jgi:hypothetical protein